MANNYQIALIHETAHHHPSALALDLQKIRKWADDQGGVTAAAKLMGMRQPHLSRLLAGGYADVKLSVLGKIASAMRCKPASLLLAGCAVTPPAHVGCVQADGKNNFLDCS